MNDDLTPEQIDRLEAALRQVLDRPDGVARARLLAALPAGGPRARVSLQRARWQMVRRVGIRAAVAAAVAIAAVGVWQAARPRSVFARAAAAMVAARGFRCDMVDVRPRDGGFDVQLAGTATWSPTGGNRMEGRWKGEASHIVILPPGRPGIELRPATKQYRVLPRDRDPEFSATLFARLAESPAPAGPPAEVRAVDGRRARRYDVAWAAVAPGTDHPGARLRVWLDEATNLPVRADLLDFTTPGGPILRLEDFRWGEPDPALFAAAPPEGYAKLPTLDARADEITEHVVYGLRTFAKYNGGRYPAVKYVYGDEQGEALRRLIGLGPKAQGWLLYDKTLKWKDPREGEFAFGSSAMGWINALQRENPDCAYNGKSVTPRDAGKVLLRWRLDDGDYRVIYGDLRVETASPARLKGIEGR